MKANLLVVDSGPLIKSLPELANISQNLITVPEVIAEIKDESSRKAIEVISFAKKTGDYSVLSLTDLKVIALTLELTEKLPESQIRLEPLPIAIIGKRTAKIDQLEPNVDKLAQKLSKVELPEQGSTETEISCTSQNDENKPVNQSTSEISYTSQNDENKPVNQSTSETNVIQESNIQETEETDSDDGEWITPENISKKRSSNDKTVNVACTTTDFAMQNVILQMNLNLISLSHKIKRQQKWVMRCHACYQICMDLQKSFCPKCGNNTLNRVTATVQNGQLTLFLKKNYQINNRGTQFSIPKHRGGRGNDMILREDQKEHLHALKLAKRFEKKAMSMDLADLDSIMFSKDRAILSGTGRPIIGHGRKNINHVQGRRRK